ncbi:MAG: caspase family protein [Thermodesulfovibrionales bacterium]|nr:caspase family protein [Thermodesulfovibrionales bacterium]
MALKLNPYSYETMKYRGIVYKNLKYYKAAAQDLTRAIIEDPNDFESFYNRGVTFYYLKEYPDSVKDLSTALQMNPKSFNAYFFRGMSYKAVKSNKKAMADFDRTLALKPTHPWAKKKRAELIAAAKSAAAGPGAPRKTAFKFPSIDASIPKTVRANPEAIAVIIGNRDYQKAKKVEYAINDVRTMKNYLMITFGFREGNIFHLENATQSEMTLYFGNKDSHKGKLFNAVRRGVSDVFIYYSGHGAPGLKDNRAYFVPVDADPQYIELGGYPADLLYRNLAKVPARSMTVVLDACFSGADIFENISPMSVKVIAPKLRMKNSVVISSSGSGEVSTWLNEQKHGLFTYFFLKGIQDQSADSNRDGSITYEEIFSSLADTSNGVPYFARRLHGVEQSPTMEGSFKDKVLISY